MMYIAIVDDEFLSNFRVDIRSNEQFCSDMVLVVTDKAGFTRGIALKPLQRVMIVIDEGNSAYLRQEHIDCLIEMERKEMFEKTVHDMMKSLGLDEDKKEPTTKNDLPNCEYTDEEIAKTFIEDVEAVKEQLPCGEQMDFPSTFDEFAKDYGFKDKDKVYTNGAELIPVFRVKQWLEHISITKNDLGVDCISRADAIQAMQDKAKKLTNEDTINGLCGAVAILFELPSVTPQEPRKGHWKLVQRGKNIDVFCSSCEAVRIKGYAYNYTIDELNKEDINECFGSAEMRYCPNCGAKMVKPQESEDKE